MTTVYKYTICPIYTKALMPKGAEILSVGFQGEALCAWALVDTEQKKEVERKFRVLGTGHPFDDFDEEYMRFLGTVFTGPLVFHVWEVLG